MTKEGYKLTKMEMEYFNLLLKNDGHAVDRSYFTQLHDDYPDSNVVDVHMKNLRRKLEGKYVIETERGIGYSMYKA